MDSSQPDGCIQPVLRIFTTRKRRGAHVALVGDLDVMAVGCLQDWARSFTAGPRPGAVCLDLSDLGFVDIAGFRALAEACGLLQWRGASVEVTGRPQSLNCIAELAGASLSGHLGRLAATAAHDAGCRSRGRCSVPPAGPGSRPGSPRSAVACTPERRGRGPARAGRRDPGNSHRLLFPRLPPVTRTRLPARLDVDVMALPMFSLCLLWM
jgi:anti-anti-sigma factor